MHTQTTVRALVLAVALLLSVPPADARSDLTDAQIRQRIIQESIASYAGPCPCPYNIARNGSRCGGRSAYSKPGGASPRCYPEDVSDEMVKEWRRRN